MPGQANPSMHFNHFSTIGRISGPAHYDVSIRQAAIEAFLASSFKIFWTQTFPRCGATCRASKLKDHKIGRSPYIHETKSGDFSRDLSKALPKTIDLLRNDLRTATIGLRRCYFLFSHRVSIGRCQTRRWQWFATFMPHGGCPLNC